MNTLHASLLRLRAAAQSPPGRGLEHEGAGDGLDTSFTMLITFAVLSVLFPFFICGWRYYSPCAEEKYKLEHKKWAEAVKLRKESKKASRKASKELAAARSSRKDSTGASKSRA
jgi:F0F1-type ATP synthase membrane subunit b/b'